MSWWSPLRASLVLSLAGFSFTAGAHAELTSVEQGRAGSGSRASGAASQVTSDAAQAHVGKGYEYVQNQRYEEAAQEFQAALALDRHLLRARYQLPVCYFALGQRKEAREQFQRLGIETSGDASVTYYLGRLDLLEGDLDSALRRLNSVASDPPFPDTAYDLGSAYLKAAGLLNESWQEPCGGCVGGRMATKTALTWEQFLAAGKPDQRWEYIDGEVRFMSPTGTRHGFVIHLIGKALIGWEDLAGDWVCFGADVAFTMADGSWLCPDAAVVRRERYRGGVPEGPTPFPPDVAFEVRSPGDKASDIERKRYFYYLNKVTQVWIDPETETVEVVSPNRPVRYFGPGETVVIEELPGFGMDLFPLLPKRVKDGKP